MGGTTVRQTLNAQVAPGKFKTLIFVGKRFDECRIVENELIVQSHIANQLKLCFHATPLAPLLNRTNDIKNALKKNKTFELELAKTYAEEQMACLQILDDASGAPLLIANDKSEEGVKVLSATLHTKIATNILIESSPTTSISKSKKQEKNKNNKTIKNINLDSKLIATLIKNEQNRVNQKQTQNQNEDFQIQFIVKIKIELNNKSVIELATQTPILSLSKKETNKKYHIINLINKNKNKNKTTAKTIDLDNALTSKRTYLVKKQSNIGGLITAIDAVQYLPTNETPTNKAQFAFSQKLRKSLVQAEARVDAARAKIQVSLNHCIY